MDVEEAREIIRLEQLGRRGIDITPATWPESWTATAYIQQRHDAITYKIAILAPPGQSTECRMSSAEASFAAAVQAANALSEDEAWPVRLELTALDLKSIADIANATDPDRCCLADDTVRDLM